MDFEGRDCFLIGADMALVTDHPLSSRLLIVPGAAPMIRSHALTQWRSPLNSTIRFLRVLPACSSDVAHRQFSGLYEPLVSMRSSEWFGDGRGPISAKNASKLSRHRSHIVMPRPPYRWKFQTALFSHRVFAQDHAAYSGVADWPCVRKRRASISRLKHPQLVVWLVLSLLPDTITVFPQAQRHAQDARPSGVFSALETTSSLPNLTPQRSMYSICSASIAHQGPVSLGAQVS